MRNLLVSLTMALFAGLGTIAAAQPAPQTVAPPQVSPSASDRPAPVWFVGLLGRVNWIPPFIPQIILEDSPAVVGPGFELLATKRNDSGTAWVFGLGYTSYSFEGPSRANGDPVVDTEYLDSNLGLIHLNASLLWSSDLVAEKLAFEYGFGLDFGVVIGKLVRSEAYQDQSGAWKPCAGPLNPVTPEYYCELTEPPGLPTNTYDQEGAHYHVTEKRIPPVMAFPHIPHLALRYTPDPKVAIKLELAYGIVQLWCGLSVHYGIN